MTNTNVSGNSQTNVSTAFRNIYSGVCGGHGWLANCLRINCWREETSFSFTEKYKTERAFWLVSSLSSMLMMFTLIPQCSVCADNQQTMSHSAWMAPKVARERERENVAWLTQRTHPVVVVGKRTNRFSKQSGQTLHNSSEPDEWGGHPAGETNVSGLTHTMLEIDRRRKRATLTYVKNAASH